MQTFNEEVAEVKAFLLIVFVTFPALAADQQPLRELLTQVAPFPYSKVPLFRHGFVVTFPPGAKAGEHPPISSTMYGFSVYAPDGTFAFSKNIEVPGGTQPVVRDLDVDTDGSVAVAATALGPTGFMLGILRFDRTGQQTGFINTGRYSPSSLAIASDHSIWTLGWQMSADHPPYPDRQDYMIVRRYSADGKEEKECLPRSSFPAGLEPGTPGPGVHIGVTRDRVGLLAWSGKTSGNAEWIELDRDGNLLDRSRVDTVVRNVALAAFTADNHVYLQGYDGEVYTLSDAASHTWKAIPKRAGSFMGVDGNSLVYRQTISGAVQLQWFGQP